MVETFVKVGTNYNKVPITVWGTPHPVGTTSRDAAADIQEDGAKESTTAGPVHQVIITRE